MKVKGWESLRSSISVVKNLLSVQPHKTGLCSFHRLAGPGPENLLNLGNWSCPR